MFPITSTIPDTFEQFVEQHNLPADHGNLEGWRRVYEQQKIVETNAPTVIPPCPWWCKDPAGHDYTSTDGWDDDLTFQRFHSHPVGQLSVDTIEHNVAGVVTLDPAGVYVDERGDNDAAHCRALAADLLAAADLLDRIASR